MSTACLEGTEADSYLGCFGLFPSRCGVSSLTGPKWMRWARVDAVLFKLSVCFFLLLFRSTVFLFYQYAKCSSPGVSQRWFLISFSSVVFDSEFSALTYFSDSHTQLSPVTVSESSCHFLHLQCFFRVLFCVVYCWLIQQGRKFSVCYLLLLSNAKREEVQCLHPPLDRLDTSMHTLYR